VRAFDLRRRFDLVLAAMQLLQRTVAEIDGLTELEKALRQLT